MSPITEQHQPLQPDNDEVDLMEIVRQTIYYVKCIWKEQRYIWFALLVTVPFGLFLAYGSKEEYTASTKILQYQNSGTSNERLSGLAGLAGIQISSNSSKQLISEQLYSELAGTLDFRIKVAETPIRFGMINKTVTPLEYFKDYTRTTLTETVYSYTIGLIGRLFSAISAQDDVIHHQVPDNGIDHSQALKQYDRDYLGRVHMIGNRVSIQSGRILTIRATMPDPVAAADMVRAMTENLVESVIEYEVRKIQEDIAYLEDQYDKSYLRFMNAQQALAIFTDKNRDTRSATSQIEAQRLQNEYNIAFQIYSNFITELEQARITLNRTTPFFTVLESVIIPNQRSSPNRGRILVLSVFFGVFVGVLFISGRLLLDFIQLREQER